MPTESLPTISVIIPVHNGAQFVADAIASALHQEYAPLEIIAVDDGSTDETPQILAKFGSRITCIRQANAGAAAARNAAMQIAGGDYLAFLDADDLWMPDKLRIQADYLRAHGDIDLVASRWQVLQTHAAQNDEEPAVVAVVTTDVATDAPVDLDTQPSEWIYNELLMDCMVHTTTVMMRRSLIERVGWFDVNLRRGQDYDYWLRASRVTPIHVLNSPLSVYRLHDNNSTRRPQNTNYAAVILERALRRWGRVGPDGRVCPLLLMRRRLSQVWFAFGYEHAHSGSLALAVYAVGRSVQAWPLYSKPWRLLAFCAITAVRRAVNFWFGTPGREAVAPPKLSRYP